MKPDITLAQSQQQVQDGSKTKIHLAIGIKAPSCRTERLPMEICVCLDSSGSMGFGKTPTALYYAKKAVVQIIENLKPRDVIHLVTFDDDAKKVVEFGTSDQKVDLLRKVSQIKASGMTDMFAGLKESVELLNSRGDYEAKGVGFLLDQSKIAKKFHLEILKKLSGAGIDTVHDFRVLMLTQGDLKGISKEHLEALWKARPTKRIKRMFLFSDGNPTVGAKDPDDLPSFLEKQKFTTSVFGVGKDFNADLLKDLAKAGNGAYYYIEDSQEIPDMLGKAFAGFVGLFGAKSKLRVWSPNNSVIKQVYGHDLRDGEHKIYGHQSKFVELGDLHGYSTQWILIEVKVDPKNLPDNGKSTPVLGWKLSWDLRTEVNIRNFSEKMFKMSKTDGNVDPNGSKLIQCLEALHMASKLDKEAQILIETGIWKTGNRKLKKGLAVLASVRELDTETKLIAPALARAKETYRRLEKAHVGDDVSGILKSIDLNSHEKSKADTYLYAGNFLKDLILEESSEHKPSNGEIYLDNFVSEMLED